MLEQVFEATGASPVVDGVGPGLRVTSDADGGVWLHARLAFDPKADLEARALAASSLIVRLSWEPSPAPLGLALLPGLPLALEALEERGQPAQIDASVSFARAFGPGRAPHLPCFVHLAAGRVTTPPQRLDPETLAELDPLESSLGVLASDMLVHAELAYARGDLPACLRALGSALDEPALRGRLVGAPLFSGAVAACELAREIQAGDEREGALERAAGWAMALLELQETRRTELARRLRSAEGRDELHLPARLAALDRIRADLTGDAAELEPLFADPAGRELRARAP